uniref:Gamma prolamin n=1 Tax=Australopyrum retrofractum TaxID=4597 RepID=H8Y0M7_9POAL|nr:gamma prolamin [Australopyrum retrofractum]AEW46821.1 gamma prolamin [Australopyrum retrofractum]AEW46822.1 gamma prolamin [Australopyrum retrofractum]
MKTLLILTILAMAITIATANMQADPSGQVQWPQQQPFLQPHQPFSQQPQQIFPQPQQTFPHQPQQQFPQPQQPQQQFLQPRQPFPQQPQQPYPQQPQQPFPQTQQPQQPFPQSKQPQQPFPQPQQPQQSFPQQQPSLIQQSLQQQLNPCKNFLLQQCKPVSLVSSLWSIILPPSDCQVMRQQCCQRLAQIPQQLQCAAIHSVVHSIIMQQEQQEQLQGVQILVPLSQQQQVGQGILVQGQGIIQPQQPAQLEVIRSLVLQTLPTMCNVYVPPYCSTIRAPFASIVAGIGGQ